MDSRDKSYNDTEVSPFPVGRNFDTVQDILIRTKIALASDSSLNPKPNIVLEDKYGPIKDVASIDPNRQAHLSVAYAQYLWILGDLVYRIHESRALNSLIRTREDYEEFLKLADSSKRVRDLMLPLLQHPVDAEYIEDKLSLMNEVRHKVLDDTVLSKLQTLDMESPIGRNANSIAAYGLAFSLCHEASHSTCGHDLNGEGCEAEENEADENAFWTMVSMLQEEEQFSAMVGVICTMVSLLFLNPTFEPDGVHPKESDRLMKHFDKIIGICPNDKREKYKSILVLAVCLWAGACDIEEFPVKYNPLSSDKEVEMIRHFFSE